METDSKEPTPGWLQPPTDFTVTDEAIAASEKFFRHALGLETETVQPSAEMTEFSKYTAAQLERTAQIKASKWEQEGTLESFRKKIHLELAFTLFCVQHKRSHPSTDNPETRLKTLQWIVDYLR